MKKKKLTIAVSLVAACAVVGLSVTAAANVDKLSLLLGDNDQAIPKSEATQQEINDNISMQNFIVSDAKPAASSDENAKLAFDGDTSTVWKAPAKENAVLQMDFDEMTVLNNVHLKESFSQKGGNCRAYHIEAWNGEEWVNIYNSDLIENYKLCVVDKIKTWAIRLVIDESGDDTVSISEMEVTNQLPVKRTEEFRHMGYIHPGHFSGDDLIMDPNLFKGVTHTMMIGFTNWASGSNGLVLNIDERADGYIDRIKEAIGDGDTQILVTMGNSGLQLTGTAEERKGIIDGIMAFVQKHDLAGVDIDYEYPNSTATWAAYSQLLVELGQALHADGRVLTAAIGLFNNRMSAEAIATVDYFNLMTYDGSGYNGWHSVFSYAWEQIPQAVAQGIPTQKINLGLPFYGQGFRNGGPDFGKTIAYNILYSPEYEDEFDPGRNEDFGYYYNGPTMIRDKTVYAIESGCGGVMSWTLGHDADYDTNYSLTRTIVDAVEAYTIVEE